jgi:hypothetical protein
MSLRRRSLVILTGIGPEHPPNSGFIFGGVIASNGCVVVVVVQKESNKNIIAETQN